MCQLSERSGCGRGGGSAAIMIQPGLLNLGYSSGKLSHSDKGALLHDSVAETSLHGRQVSVAFQHEIGISLAGQYILPRRGQDRILILPADEFQGSLPLGDIP